MHDSANHRTFTSGDNTCFLSHATIFFQIASKCALISSSMQISNCQEKREKKSGILKKKTKGEISALKKHWCL